MRRAQQRVAKQSAVFVFCRLVLTFNFTPSPELRTTRLQLRAAQPAGAVAAALRSPRVMCYLDREPSQSMAEVETVIERMQQDTAAHHSINWLLTPLGSGGRCSVISGLEHETRTPRRRSGLRAAPRPLEPGPDERSVVGGVALVREAYFRQDYYFRGQFLDSAIYSLLTPLAAAPPVS